mmetsp:Transcript_16093/g.42323  ORF Transcript_16093/g.42323 Transcript_16093/m.42323 type:complete len:265 (-) Transcript_16093:404-1198(-)
MSVPNLSTCCNEEMRLTTRLAFQVASQLDHNVSDCTAFSWLSHPGAKPFTQHDLYSTKTRKSARKLVRTSSAKDDAYGSMTPEPTAAAFGIENQGCAPSALASCTMYSTLTPQRPACVWCAGRERLVHCRTTDPGWSHSSTCCHPAKRSTEVPRKVSRNCGWNNGLGSSSAYARGTKDNARNGFSDEVPKIRTTTPLAGRTKMRADCFPELSNSASPSNETLPTPSHFATYSPSSTKAPPRPMVALADVCLTLPYCRKLGRLEG